MSKQPKELVEGGYDAEKLTGVEIAALINKKFGSNVLSSADQSSSPFMLRRPTGSISMDISIGGGIPAGGSTQIAGVSGIGKNSLANTIIANLQKIYGEDTKIAWICTELPYDKQHGRINGVVVPASDKDIWLENRRRAKDGEDPLNDEEIDQITQSVGEFVIGDRGTTEERLQAAVEIINSHQYQLIVIDSIGAVVSKYRVDTDLKKESKQAATASLLSDFQRKCWNAFCGGDDMNTTSMILINQVRANRQAGPGPFVREWKVTDPHAIKHGKLLDIILTKGKNIPEKGIPKLGKVVNWEIAKGKAGCHEGGRGELSYYYDSGFDLVVDLVKTGRNLEVIQRRGRSKHDVISKHGEAIVENLPAGKGAVDLISAIREDDDLFWKIYYECLSTAKVSFLHKI